MGQHSLVIPDNQTPNDNADDLHRLDHNVVVSDSDPYDEQGKTQLQRDEEYRTMSMGESQRMLAAEEMDQVTTPVQSSAGILSRPSETTASSHGKLQVSADFAAEMHAREEEERKAKEQEAIRRQEAEFQRLAQTDSHHF